MPKSRAPNLEVLVSELMAVDLAMKQEGLAAGEWYRLAQRHRELRAQVMDLDEPLAPGSASAA